MGNGNSLRKLTLNVHESILNPCVKCDADVKQDCQLKGHIVFTDGKSLECRARSVNIVVTVTSVKVFSKITLKVHIFLILQEVRILSNSLNAKLHNEN